MAVIIVMHPCLNRRFGETSYFELAVAVVIVMHPCSNRRFDETSYFELAVAAVIVMHSCSNRRFDETSYFELAVVIVMYQCFSMVSDKSVFVDSRFVQGYCRTFGLLDMN